MAVAGQTHRGSESADELWAGESLSPLTAREGPGLGHGAAVARLALAAPPASLATRKAHHGRSPRGAPLRSLQPADGDDRPLGPQRTAAAGRTPRGRSLASARGARSLDPGPVPE